MHRRIRFAALLGIAILAVLWVAVWVVQSDPAAFAGTPFQPLVSLLQGGPASGSGLSGVRIGGPFTLVDSNGKTVTEAAFRGQWMLLYFGYTYCPDVCPTELQTMAAALAKLGPDSQKIVPIFVTVDPERDTPEVIGQYVRVFDPRLVGLTGTPKQIADVARAYRVYYAKTSEKAESTYLMDHSTLVYLMDPEGRFAALYNPHTSAEELAAGLREHLSQRG